MFPTMLPHTDESINALIKERQAAIRADFDPSDLSRPASAAGTSTAHWAVTVLPHLVSTLWPIRHRQKAEHARR